MRTIRTFSYLKSIPKGKFLWYCRLLSCSNLKEGHSYPRWKAWNEKEKAKYSKLHLRLTPLRPHNESVLELRCRGGWYQIGHETMHWSILCCPTFVLEHGDLGRTRAGWLHKVFATNIFLYFFGTHIFLFVFPRFIFFGWAVLKEVASHPIHALWIRPWDVCLIERQLFNYKE